MSRKPLAICAWACGRFSILNQKGFFLCPAKDIGCFANIRCLGNYCRCDQPVAPT